MRRQLDDVPSAARRSRCSPRPRASSTAASATAWRRRPWGSPSTGSTRTVARPVELPGADRDARPRRGRPSACPTCTTTCVAAVPGALSRPTGWWAEFFRDPEDDRDGASRRVLRGARVRQRGGRRIRRYRVKKNWTDSGVAAGDTLVYELYGSSPTVPRRALAVLPRRRPDCHPRAVWNAAGRRAPALDARRPTSFAGHRGQRLAVGPARRRPGRAERPPLPVVGPAGART